MILEKMNDNGTTSTLDDPIVMTSMIMLVVPGIFFLFLCRFYFATSRPSVLAVIIRMTVVVILIFYSNYLYPSSTDVAFNKTLGLGLLVDFQLFSLIPDFKYLYTNPGVSCYNSISSVFDRSSRKTFGWMNSFIISRH